MVLPCRVGVEGRQAYPCSRQYDALQYRARWPKSHGLGDRCDPLQHPADGRLFEAGEDCVSAGDTRLDPTGSYGVHYLAGNIVQTSGDSAGARVRHYDRIL